LTPVMTPNPESNSLMGDPFSGSDPGLTQPDPLTMIWPFLDNDLLPIMCDSIGFILFARIVNFQRLARVKK
jgi:hypothetical protein